MSKTDNFIIKAKLVHGDVYDYSLVNYIHSSMEVDIICKEHGVFSQKPINHTARKRGCNKCAIERNAIAQTKSISQFLHEAKAIHGKTYGYDKSEYTGWGEKIIVTCKRHGDFKISPASHIDKKAGCIKCYNEKTSERQKIPFAKFLKEAKAVHGELYRYVEDSYMGVSEKIDIICREHGLFPQTAYNHTRGSGCPQCSTGHRGEEQRIGTDEYIRRCKDIHGEAYDYSAVEYTGKYNKVKIRCIKHNYLFEQMAEVHYKAGCPKCGNSISKTEDEIATYLTGLKVKVIKRDKKILDGIELDIVIPEHKIAIEYNGLRWHSEKFGRGRHYHLGKTKLCQEKGYRLIHIFEDDFRSRKSVILDFLSHLVGKSEKNIIYGRKTTITKIDTAESKKFLDIHHIQGSAKASFSYGIFYNGELVAVTSFKKGSKNTKNKDSMELVRHATKYTVIGALGKSIKHFQRQHSERLFTFCDDSFFSGDSYIKAGFKKDGKIPPDYKYVIGKNREHKFKWRLKQISTKLGITGLSEYEAMKSVGFYRIWDCGKTKYTLL